MACGYNVTYQRFSGDHLVPPAIANDTMRFFLGTFGSIGSLPTDLTCGPGP